MNGDTSTISIQAKMRNAFEQTANTDGRFYNFTPAGPELEGQTYWSLHAERAWRIFQIAYLLGMGERGSQENKA